MQQNFHTLVQKSNHAVHSTDY